MILRFLKAPANLVIIRYLDKPLRKCYEKVRLAEGFSILLPVKRLRKSFSIEVHNRGNLGEG
jgi:hypothetical protein